MEKDKEDFKTIEETQDKIGQMIEAETIVPNFEYAQELPKEYFYKCNRTNEIKQILPQSLIPQLSYCTTCNKEVLTKVKKTIGRGNYSTCCCFAVIGCCCFSWVSFVVDNFKDSTHLCPDCDKQLNFVPFLNE